MAAIIILSDFGAQKNKVWHCLHCFPIYFPWSDGTRCHDLSFFWMLSFKPAFSLFSFTFIKRLFSSSLSAIRVVSSTYLRLLIFLLPILIPACASFSLAFCMMYSAYKLNKQGDKIQPLTMWIRTICGKFFKRWEYQTTLPASWEICMHVKKQQLELDMEQQTRPDQERSMSRLYNL